MLSDETKAQQEEEPPSTAVPLIDAHTHSWLKGDGILRVRNVFPDAGSIQHLPEYFSIGIHPFQLEDSEITKQEMQNIRDVISKNPGKALAVGECGLDHFSAHPLELQEKIFIEQIKIAEEHDLPVVVHAVRSWHDIIRIKKEYSKKQRVWLAHGFRGSEETAEDLLDHNIRLSFGDALLRDEKTQEKFLEIPDDAFLLETDEAPVDINEIYETAARLREISIDELRKRLYANFREIFFGEKQ